MAKKYYAVAKGKKTGIFMTWNECKAQVHGCAGAVYKSFPTMEEAKKFLELGSVLSQETPVHSEEHKPQSDEEHAVAYVDGSYNAASHTFAYGVVMFWNGEEFHMSEQVKDENLVDMRNVAGEICGAKAAMQFALEKDCKELVIYHDYEGIAKWPLGMWKTNKEGTAAYKRYYDEVKETLLVKFVKVKGHSNDTYNEMADQLAKAAIF